MAQQLTSCVSRVVPMMTEMFLVEDVARLDVEMLRTVIRKASHR